jgi:hypothetical protein
VLLNVGLDDGRPHRPSEIDAQQTTSDDPFGAVSEVHGSTDGRWTTADRPAVSEGRLPTGANEAFIDVEAANRGHFHIGDRVPLAFYGAADQLLAQQDDAPIEPVGRVELTIVGFGTFADEVLPDGLYPRGRAIVSADVTARFSCDPQPLPARGTYEEITAAVFPHGCAINYRYYSLVIDGGDQGVATAQAAFQEQADALNAQLPQALVDHQVGYVLIPSATATVRDQVDRSTRPAVTALVALGLVAGVVALIVAWLAVARDLRRSSDEQRQWSQLGLTATERAAVLVAPVLGALAIGVVLALALAWVLSTVGPVGNVRSIEPSPDRVLPTRVLEAAAVVALVLLAGVAVLTARATRSITRTRSSRSRPGLASRLVHSSSRPAVTEGLRAALDTTRGSGLVMATGAVAVALLLGAVVWGASLDALVSTPRSYGWPWDFAVVTNYVYGGLDLSAVEDTMRSRSDVDRWSALAFTNSIAVDGEPVVSLVGLGDGADAHFAYAHGRAPVADDEVALGAATAAAHGVAVGDQVDLQGEPLTPHRATVTGIVVLPAVGPFQSARATPGDGMVLPSSMFDADSIAGLVTFVGVDLRAGADQARTVDALRGDFPAWGIDSFRVEYAKPVRPAEVIDAEGMSAVPLLAGGLLGAALLVGLSLAIFVSTRARQRELSILRALGFTGRQLRTSVRVQAVGVMVAAIVVGIPLGIAAGRAAWRTFARQLAVVLDPSLPAVWLLASITLGFVVVALLAAAVPARFAARSRPSAVLRSE